MGTLKLNKKKTEFGSKPYIIISISISINKKVASYDKLTLSN